MSKSSQPSQEGPLWDLYSGAILLLLVFFQLMTWPLSPKFLDIYYHLSAMKGFADAGGFVTHAFWEYAPDGRPHLYPPVLHVLMLLFYKLGLPAIDVGRLVDVSSYPLLMFVYWYVARRIYTDKIAFIALVLFSSVYSVLLASVTLSAFNLAAVFMLLMVWKMHVRRFVQAGVLLGLMFYTHTYAAGLGIILIILCGVGQLKDLKKYFLALLIGVAIGAPFIAYQLHFKDFFVMVSKDLKESSLLEVDAVIYALAALSLWSCRSKDFLRRVWVPMAMWLCFAPMIMTHPVRFFFGHGLMGLVLLSSVALDKITQKSIKWLPIILVFAVFVGPVFHWNFAKREGKIHWADRTLVRYLVPDPYLATRTNGFTIYFQEPYNEMKEIIQANSQKGDIIWTDFSYTAGILAVLSDRVTSCAMLAEVKPFKASHRIQDAKTIIWFKDADLKPMPGMDQAVKKYDLRLLKEVEMAFIFDNPKPAIRTKVPKPILPSYACIFLVVVALGISLYPYRL